MRRICGVVVVLAALLLGGRAEAQSCNGCGIGYTPATNTGRANLVDEFGTGLTTTGNVGQLGWNYANYTVTGTAESGHPGICRATGGASATNTLYIHPSAYLMVLSDLRNYKAIVRSATDANIPKKRVGLNSSIAADGTGQGVYFEHLPADTNWFAVARDADSEERADTGVAFAANTWLTFEIALQGQAFVYSIDGVVKASLTGSAQSVPALGTTVMPYFQLVTTGTAVAFDIDYFELIFEVVR